MPFELPFPPFPHDSRDVPFIATPDDNNGYTVPSSQYFKKLVGDKYLWTPVSDDTPLPTSDAATLAKLAEILAKLSDDPATQTTLAAILAKIIDAPATEEKQTALNALIGEVQDAPTANTLLARLKNLETKVDAIIADGIKLSGSKVAVKRHTLSDVIPFNNYLFVGENTRAYCTTGFLAWHCEYPKKMVIIKNTSEFAIQWGWYLYDHLDVATDQLGDTGIIASSSSLVDLAAGATVEIPFDTLKYPAVGASVYLLHTAGGSARKGSATIQFLGGV